MTPGVLVAWSGSQPMSRVVHVPREGLVIGRTLIGEGTGDDKISREHARITASAEAFVVEDLESRNGTFVQGTRISGSAQATPGALVRTGRTVVFPFTDVAPFEAVAGVTTRDGLIAGRRMAAIHDALDDAARAGAHVVIAGDPGIGRARLAQMYAAKLGAPIVARVYEDPVFGKDDVPALLAEVASSPDLRLVVTRNRYARSFAEPIEAFLAAHARTIDVPSLRHRADEVAEIVFTAISAIEPGLECHHSLFEHCMLRKGNLSEIALGLRDVARIEHGTTIRAEDLEAAIRRNWVRLGANKRRH